MLVELILISNILFIIIDSYIYTNNIYEKTNLLLHRSGLNFLELGNYSYVFCYVT
jgi:hypothetical protein